MERDAERLEQRPSASESEAGKGCTSRSGHAISSAVRRRSRHDRRSGRRSRGAEAPAADRAAAARIGGIDSDALAGARPGLDRRRELMPEDERACSAASPMPLRRTSAGRSRRARRRATRRRISPAAAPAPARRADEARRRRAAGAPSPRLAVVGAGAVLAQEMAPSSSVVDLPRAPRRREELVRSASGDRLERDRVLDRAPTSAPQTKGPWEATSAAGTSSGSSPRSSNASTISVARALPRSRPRSPRRSACG